MVQGKDNTNGRPALDSRPFELDHDHTFYFDPTYDYGSNESSEFQPLDINAPIFRDDWDALPPGNASIPNRNDSDALRNDISRNMINAAEHIRHPDNIPYHPPQDRLASRSSGHQSVIQPQIGGSYGQHAWEQESRLQPDLGVDDAFLRGGQYPSAMNRNGFNEEHDRPQRTRNSQQSSFLGFQPTTSDYAQQPGVGSPFDPRPKHSSKSRTSKKKASYPAVQVDGLQYSGMANRQQHHNNGEFGSLSYGRQDSRTDSSQGVPSAPYSPFDRDSLPLQYGSAAGSLLPAPKPNHRQRLQTGVDPNLTASTHSRINRKRAASPIFPVAAEEDEGFESYGDNHEDEEDEMGFDDIDDDDEEFVPSPSPPPRPSKYRRTSKMDTQRRHGKSKSGQRVPPQQSATPQQRHVGPRTTNVPTNFRAPKPGKGFDGLAKQWCRIHKREGFQVAKYRVGPWRNAIRHDDLRPLLYNQARALGTFRYPREAGSVPGDLTSFHPVQKDWGFDPNKRRRWPKVLFQLNVDLKVQWYPPHLTESQGEWIWNNLVVVDRDNKPLKVWPLLNDTCSSQFEAGCMEALFRLCPGMDSGDIFGRTPDVPSVPVGSSGFNARRNRFRDQNGLISWTPRAGSGPMKKAVLKKVGKWGLENNSTKKFKGFTEEELAEVKKVNKTSSASIKKSEAHQKRQHNKMLVRVKKMEEEEEEQARALVPESSGVSESEDDEDDEEEEEEEEDNEGEEDVEEEDEDNEVGEAEEDEYEEEGDEEE